MKIFMIAFDDENNASIGYEIKNIGMEDPNSDMRLEGLIGKRKPTEQIKLSFTPVDNKGEANSTNIILKRKYDSILDKYLETKANFKVREHSFWSRLLKKRNKMLK